MIRSAYSRRGLAISGLLAALLVPASAGAHITITSHTTRFGPNDQKEAPCGIAGGSEPGAMVYTYEPGETINIAWNEFINHPGHYRVAFDADGDDDFITPASADDLNNDDSVLLDGIPDLPGVSNYDVDIVLPNIECEQCTLQVIQVMTDKDPFGDGDDIYFQCIDIQLVAAGGSSDTGDTTDTGEDTTDGDTSETAGDTETDDGGSVDTGIETSGVAADEGDGCACSAAGAPGPAPVLAGLLGLSLLGLRRSRAAV